MNVTYLLGAGASANAIPIAENFIVNIKKVTDALSNELSKQLPSLLTRNERLYEDIESLIRKLRELYINYQSVFSMDTVARIKHRFTNSMHDEKEAIYLLINLYQGIMGYDNRYNNLISHLIDNPYLSKHSLNIISWNYDTILESQFSRYVPGFDVYLYSESIRNKKFYTFGAEDFKFNYFKPNGSAFINLPNNPSILQSNCFINKQDDELQLKYINNFFKNTQLYEHLEKSIWFAWEDDRVEQEIDKMEEIDCLVIIGYSFPDLNYKVDKKILGKLSSRAKVYFQDLDPKPVIERFKNIRWLPDELLHAWPYVKSFLIPPELLSFEA